MANFEDKVVASQVKVKLGDTMILAPFELRDSSSFEALCKLAARIHEKELKDKEFTLTYVNDTITMDKDGVKSWITSMKKRIPYFVVVPKILATRNQKRARNDGIEPSTMHKWLMEVNPKNFGDPSALSWLPFPMLGDYPIPERFQADGYRFPCVGREIFPKLDVAVQDFLCCGATPTIVDSPKTHNTHQVLRRMLVYGNTGTGKSHLLMMLGMSLRKQFHTESPMRRVVILPSAFLLVTYKMDFLLSAVKLACVGDEGDLAELENIEDAKTLGKFCVGDTRYIFIVDQADCLEVVKDDEDTKIVATLAKEARDMLTSVVGHRNFIIYGSSANNATAKYRFKKQQDILFYDIFGGFSKIEMEGWLKHVCKVDLSADQKDQLLVDTGAVPLFLTWFWPTRNSDLVDYSTDDVGFAEQRSKFLSHRSFLAAIADVDNWVKTQTSNTGFEELASASEY